MKPFYMGWNQLRDALLDSSIDAMVMAVSMRPSGTWSPVPVYQEIAVSRQKQFDIFRQVAQSMYQHLLVFSF